MKRLIIITLVLFLAFIPCKALAVSAEEADETAREELDEGINETLDGLDLSSLEELYDEEKILDGSLRDAVKRISEEGLKDISAKELWEIIKSSLADALRLKIGTAIKLVILMVILSVLARFAQDSSLDGAAGAGVKAGYIGCCILAFGMIASTLKCASEAISDMSRTMDTLTPLLTALLTAIGSSTSASVMSPLMSALTGTVFKIIEAVIFPAITVMTAMSMLGLISEELDLTSFISLGEKVIKWILGAVFVVFIGLLAIKGIGGAVNDGIYFKTTKYTVEKMVPVVGGMFSDTLDTLTACAVILQNSVGTVGMLILAAKLLSPVLAIAADMIIFKISAAAASPLVQKNACDMLEKMAHMAELTNGALLVCAGMSFISVALFIGSADVSFMMR